MKIIIVGAGKIGRNLARTLSEENNEVFVIEQRDEILEKIADTLDVQVVEGNGADPDILKRAKVESADLVMAVTTSDETNLVVCNLAALFGAKRRIARVRNFALSELLSEHGAREFRITDMINPELVAANSIMKTIEAPGASEVADFADGKLLLRGFDVSDKSPMCGQTLASLRDEDFPWPFLIIAIIREKEVFFPNGESKIEPGDHVYVFLPRHSLAEFLTYIDPEARMPQKAIVYGATITGRHAAETLAKKLREVILIEEDIELAQDVAEELDNVRIFSGTPTETAILLECGVEASDVFVAASKNDHANLVSSVLAKNMGAKKTIIITQQPDYMALSDALNVDSIINPQYLAAEQILHLVRGGQISSVTKLVDCKAEAVEFIAKEGSKITLRPLSELSFPKGAIVGAVIHDLDRVELAKGDTHIRTDDRVIVFSQSQSMKKLQAMFTR